jgi:hypothetical protein
VNQEALLVNVTDHMSGGMNRSDRNRDISRGANEEPPVSLGKLYLPMLRAVEHMCLAATNAWHRESDDVSSAPPVQRRNGPRSDLDQCLICSLAHYRQLLNAGPLRLFMIDLDYQVMASRCCIYDALTSLRDLVP